jgi:hypothetical protein
MEVIMHGSISFYPVSFASTQSSRAHFLPMPRIIQQFYQLD